MANAAKNPLTDGYLEVVRKFPLRPIRTEERLRAAHKVIDELTKIPEEKTDARSG